MRIAFTLLFVPFVYCQDVERVFRLTGGPDLQRQQEIVTTLRTVNDLAKVTLDQGSATVTIHAPAAQVAFAEWMIPRLDHPPSSSQRYTVAGNQNDVAMVYPMTGIKDVRGLQEVITTLRTVVDLRRVYNISSAYMLAFRGRPATIDQANFLLSELDRPPQTTQTAVRDHFSITNPFRDFDTLTAYHLTHANNNLAIQEIITNLRTVVDIQKIYPVTSNATLSLCANQDNTRVAEWLIDRLDRTAADPDVNQLQMPGGKDDAIRVLYLSRLSGGSQIKPLYDSVRSGTAIQKSFWITSPAALVVRGTADAITAAARLVKEADAPR